MEECLVFDGVTFSYKENRRQGVKILDQLSFTIHKSEFVSVVGPSGSGKSTLFRLISGLENQDKGRILVNGEAVEDRLGHIGYMAQKDGLLPWMTVMENVRLPLSLKGVKGKNVYKELLDKLDRFGLKGYEQRYPHELSGGMRQRVSFLRALLGGFDLLLLDEPFSALDAVTKSMMQEWLLKQWNETKKTILFITHDVEEALFLSDRILLFGEHPVKHLQEIQVPLGRPRTISDLKDPQFTSLKEKLLLDLRNKVTI
ncbi:ABC transporter ATP-binding protein [Siminovitchia sediminis]|uniref:ABC transporter ATP-binding protein n=1 Tax=Siminovitchia sediminis TaxID=1274353 RepID=A0ABW4KHH8_9BACI